MVIGIVAVVLTFIPCMGWIAFLPSIVGLVLGIVDVSSKKKANLPAGKGIAGIVCNSVAILIAILWIFVFAGAAAMDPTVW